MSVVNTPTFNIPEKMALVQLIYSVLIANRLIRQKEIQLISKLMSRLNFDTSFIQQAQTLKTNESLSILKKMQHDKKQAVGQILNDVAKKEGFVFDNEMTLLLNIFGAIGIGSSHLH